MVLTTATLDLAKTSGIDVFDNITHVGFGTGTNTPLVSDTTLQTEVGTRLEVTGTKDAINNIYDFEVRVPLTDFVASTLAEIAFFDASTNGTMYGRLLLDPTILQTGEEAHVITVRFKTNAINKT
jgi:hypothetical protein